MDHELKTDPEVFAATEAGIKEFEIRFNDRRFQVGDYLKLRETRHSGIEMKRGKPLEYTGKELLVKVQYILEGPIYGLSDGWVIMSVKEMVRF